MRMSLTDGRTSSHKEIQDTYVQSMATRSPVCVARSSPSFGRKQNRPEMKGTIEGSPGTSFRDCEWSWKGVGPKDNKLPGGGGGE